MGDWGMDWRGCTTLIHFKVISNLHDNPFGFFSINWRIIAPLRYRLQIFIKTSVKFYEQQTDFKAT